MTRPHAKLALSVVAATVSVWAYACVGDDAAVSSSSTIDGGGSDGPGPGDGGPGVDGASNDAGADAAEGGVVYTYTAALSTAGKWESTTIAGATSTAGTASDGKFVYVAGSKLLQYDTSKPFATATSWTSFDPSTSGPLGAAGIAGTTSVVIAGNFVFFTPGADPNGGTWLRYDSTKPFDQVASWTAFKQPAPAGKVPIHTAGGFDGKNVYGAPQAFYLNQTSGLFTRYDTTGTFDQAASWGTFDLTTLASGANEDDVRGLAFDGRYMYLPHFSTNIVQYDTTATLTSAGGYKAFSASALNANARGFFGGVFDGQFLYFAPQAFLSDSSGITLRYDTKKPFQTTGSWDVMDLAAVDLVHGFAGAQFDGKYIYFAPFWSKSLQAHGHVFRYDTAKPFADKTSWESYDLVAGVSAQAKGFEGASFDGRYLYMVNGSGFVVRFDAKSPTAIPKPTASFF